jgi:GT2 family glycosyltransferase
MDLALARPDTQAPERTASLAPARPETGLAEPRLSVVVVNYRQWPRTATLTEQLLSTACAGTTAAEVVVVDNHSPAHPLARRLRRRPAVSLRRWGRNRGFARAVNEGCRLARGRWLLLLNPDVSVPPGFLDGVLALADRLADEEPRAGIVGFGLRNPDGTRQLSCGPFPTLAGSLARLLLPRSRRKYLRVPGATRRRVPWVTGCCLLVRRDCLLELGGLDADFFLYYEDVDLCRRAAAHGWSVWYEPGLKVVHHGPLHGRRVPAHLRLVTRHALLTYVAKHWPRWQVLVLAAIVGVEARLRRWWALGGGQAQAAALFGELCRIAADMAACRPRHARRRLDRVVRREEERLGA